MVFSASTQNYPNCIESASELVGPESGVAFHASVEGRSLVVAPFMLQSPISYMGTSFVVCLLKTLVKKLSVRLRDLCVLFVYRMCSVDVAFVACLSCVSC